MPTTSATIVKTVSAGSIVPDFYGNAGNVANAGTDKVEWDGNYATPLTVRVQNPSCCASPPTISRIPPPAPCALALGLLKKIEPSVPDRPAIRVLELKFTANTALTRKFGNGANPNIKTHLDGALIDATHKTTQAVPFEMYNLWKMTAKEMMTNATTGGASEADYTTATTNSTAPGAGAEVYVAWETVGREYDTKIHTTSV
eukprot:tig00020629_g12483.t1